MGQLSVQDNVRDELTARLKAAEAWMGTFAGAMDGFQKGLDLTVEQGFTYAGTNLHSRETLIASLRQFSKAIVPAQAEEKK
jgi:hypothetical protein